MSQKFCITKNFTFSRLFRGCIAFVVVVLRFFRLRSASLLSYRVASCFFHKFFSVKLTWDGAENRVMQGFYMTCRIWLASNAKPGISVTPDVTFPDFTQIMLGYSSSPESNKKYLVFLKLLFISIIKEFELSIQYTNYYFTRLNLLKMGSF